MILLSLVSICNTNSRYSCHNVWFSFHELHLAHLLDFNPYQFEKLFSAHLLVSCPYTSLMPNTMASRPWTLDEIISSFKCFNCYQDSFNRWAPCVRQYSQINCHPNFTSRGRQIWFLVFNFLKYLRCGPLYGDEDYTYQGEHSVKHHVYFPSMADQRNITPNVPKHLQQSTIITKGKCHFY